MGFQGLDIGSGINQYASLLQRAYQDRMNQTHLNFQNQLIQQQLPHMVQNPFYDQTQDPNFQANQSQVLSAQPQVNPQGDIASAQQPIPYLDASQGAAQSQNQDQSQYPSLQPVSNAALTTPPMDQPGGGRAPARTGAQMQQNQQGAQDWQGAAMSQLAQAQGQQQNYMGQSDRLIKAMSGQPMVNSELLKNVMSMRSQDQEMLGRVLSMNPGILQAMSRFYNSSVQGERADSGRGGAKAPDPVLALTRQIDALRKSRPTYKPEKVDAMSALMSGSSPEEMHAKDLSDWQASDEGQRAKEIDGQIQQLQSQLPGLSKLNAPVAKTAASGLPLDVDPNFKLQYKDETGNTVVESVQQAIAKHPDKKDAILAAARKKK